MTILRRDLSKILAKQIAEMDGVIQEFRDAVNEQRLMLVAEGLDILVAGYGTVALQGRPEDQQTIQGLAFGAQLRLAAGDVLTPTVFLDRNNVEHSLTPMQVLEVWQKGATFVSQVYARSWAIKKMDPLTTDPEDDILWNITTNNHFTPL